MVKICGPYDKTKFNTEKFINTCSFNFKDTFQELSPFFLGPYTSEEGLTSKNIENYWQYSKVYKDQVNESGEPSQDWFKWRLDGFNSKRADRYPRGKEYRHNVLYSYLNGVKYDYIEAREHLYIKAYASTVSKTKAFKELKALYDAGVDFVLFDVDGYDYLSKGKTLENVFFDKKKPMGHAFVLAMMLEGYVNLDGTVNWTP